MIGGLGGGKSHPCPKHRSSLNVLVMKHVKVVCHLRVRVMVVTLVNKCIALLFFLNIIVLMESVSTYFNTIFF